MSAAGASGEDGTFVIPDATIGHVLIVLSTESTRMFYPEKYVEIPKKYGNPSTTDLAVEIKPEGNEPLELVLQ